ADSPWSRMLHLTCPHCETFLRVPSGIRAGAIACAHCHATFPLPATLAPLEDSGAAAQQPYAAVADWEYSPVLTGMMAILTVSVVGGVLLSGLIILLCLIISAIGPF